MNSFKVIVSRIGSSYYADRYRNLSKDIAYNTAYDLISLKCFNGVSVVIPSGEVVYEWLRIPHSGKGKGRSNRYSA